MLLYYTFFLRNIMPKPGNHGNRHALQLKLLVEELFNRSELMPRDICWRKECPISRNALYKSKATSPN